MKASPRARNRDLLPSHQLAAAIDRMILKADTPRVIFSGPVTNKLYSSGPGIRAGLGLNERIHYGWRNGDRPTLGIDRADEILTRAGLFWWDVWNEDTVRRPVLTVTTYVRQTKMSRGRPYGCRATKRVVRYGDQGTDWTELRRIQELWEPAETRAGEAA